MLGSASRKTPVHSADYVRRDCAYGLFLTFELSDFPKLGNADVCYSHLSRVLPGGSEQSDVESSRRNDRR